MKKLLYLLAVTAFVSCSSSSSGDDNTPVTEEPTTPENPEVPANVTETAIASYPGYTLIWNDEFSANHLDTSKWSYETGTGVNGDFGTGQLDRATDRTANVDMLAGTGTDYALAITTKKESYMDRNYTSGRINTNTKFACGPGTRIEARIWARDTKYKGQGFAFWMMPAEKPAGQDYIMWPQGGEVDIMEYVGAIPNYNLGTVHYAFSYDNNEYHDGNHGHQGAYYSYESAQVPAITPQYGNYPPAATDTHTGSAGYHLYRVDWFNDRIEFSVDGNVYHINYFNDGAAFNNAPDGQDANNILNVNGRNTFISEYSEHFSEWKPFEHNFYLILSAGVGGNDNLSYGGAIVPEAKFPCTTLVDYVRVYKRN